VPSTHQLLQFLDAFDRLRGDALRVEEAYFDRLMRLAGIAGPSSPARPPAVRRAVTLRSIRNVLRVLPRFARQYARIVRGNEGRGALLIGLATNRTLPARQRPLQEELALLARALPAGASHRLSEQIGAADTVWIVDAMPISALWWSSREQSDDAPLIIDTAFLSFFTLLTAVSHPLAAAKAVIGAILSRARRGAEIRASRVVLTALWALGYVRLLECARSSITISLTSNSFTIELLRFVALHRPRTEVIEIMHGVGSIPFERYISDLLRAVPQAQQQLKLVAQVPNVRLYQALRDQELSGEAVNTYANQYLLEHATTVGDLVTRVRADLAVPLSMPPAPLIVGVLGNFPTDGRLFESPSFHSECYLIRLIARSAARLRRRVHFVYCPHPAFGASNFENELFREHGVVICRRTQSAWLGADICVSLMSSTLIETEFFGARALTPLLATDGFFPEHYLAAVASPADGSADALIAAIDNAVSQAAPAANLSDRIEERFRRTSWAANVESTARV
jgi:hypothetical protein